MPPSAVVAAGLGALALLPVRDAQATLVVSLLRRALPSCCDAAISALALPCQPAVLDVEHRQHTAPSAASLYLLRAARAAAPTASLVAQGSQGHAILVVESSPGGGARLLLSVLRPAASPSSHSLPQVQVFHGDIARSLSACSLAWIFICTSPLNDCNLSILWIYPNRDSFKFSNSSSRVHSKKHVVFIFFLVWTSTYQHM